MSVYQKIKPDGDSLALALAGKALKGYLSAATARPGSLYIPNGDGTGTLIGPAAGTDGTGGANGLVPWVGDTTPPGKPTGVSASSAWGIVYCKWDGTLEGGVPADFAYVSVTIDDVEVAQLTKAGSFSSQGYKNGAEIVVGFTAYDDAHDRYGNPDPNSSETVSIPLTVSDERDEIDRQVEEIKQDAADAAQAAQEAWDKAEQQAQAVADAAEKAQQAADKADQAMSDLSETADELTGQITQVTTKVNGVEQDVSELSTSVSGAVTTAQGALTAATEAKQTAEGVSASATQALEKADSALNKAAEVELTADGLSTQVTAAMDTATDALNKAAEVELTADGIQADLTKNYVSKTDAANTYTTKTEFKATSEGLQADISEVTTTAEGALTKANNLEVTAEGLRADLTETTTTADSALNKANTTEVTVNGMKQTLTETTNTANSALSKSTSLETTVNGIKTQVESVSSTASDALKQASAAQQDINGFKTTVSNTYATKGELDDISVGGTNLVPFTGSAKGYHNNSPSGASLPALQDDQVGEYYRKSNSTTKESFACSDRFTIPRDGQCTLSIMIRCDSNYKNINGATNIYYFSREIGSGSDYDTTGGIQSTNVVFSEAGKWKLVTWTFTPKHPEGYIRIDNEGSKTSGVATNLDFTMLKVEMGNKATDWSPAPSDMLTGDEAAEVYATQSSVEQTASSILAEVSENYVNNETGQTYASKTSVEQLPASIMQQVEAKYQSKDGMSSYYTKTQIDQQRDSIELSVSQSISDIQVGGRNLLRETESFSNTDVSSSTNGYLRLGWTVQSSKYGRLTVRGGTKSGSAQPVVAEWLINDFDLGDEFTFSFYVKGTGNKVRAYFYGTTGYVTVMRVASSNGLAASGYGDGNTDLPVTEDWKRVWVVYRLNSTGNTSVDKYVLIRTDSTTSGGTVYVCGAKLEKGNKATDWSPAPEDDSTKLSSLSLDLDSITGEVSDLNGNQSKLTQTVNGFEGRLTTAEGDIDKAQSTADSANTKATNAQTAATNAAKTATNYISWSTNGLVVGTNSGGTGQTNLLGNTRMYSGGMEVRNGTTVLARYGASTVELGVNSASSVIKMCGGHMTISYVSNGGTQIKSSGGLQLGEGNFIIPSDTRDTQIGRTVSDSQTRVYGSALVFGSAITTSIRMYVGGAERYLVPVYRLYNQYTQAYLMVADEDEKDGLVKAGWQVNDSDTFYAFK